MMRSQFLMNLFRLLILCAIMTLLLLLKYIVFIKILLNPWNKGVHKTILNSSVNMKYILLWNTPVGHTDWVLESNRKFTEENCTYTNCFVTTRRNLLGHYANFDVIAFDTHDLSFFRRYTLPRVRSPHQKYVFGTQESADNYPICSDRFNGFFNWTWTYKLDSDAIWGYFVVRDSNWTVIGPKKDMHWMKVEDMDPVPDVLKDKLRSKRRLAAWFVSNCNTRSEREKFVIDLNNVLRSEEFQVDIFGDCAKINTCTRDNETQCDAMVATDYYFYMAFENSFSEDYVTEKLLRALEFNAIPVVYGGANYSRFMPDGIYLNARELGVEKLAKKMIELALDFEKYTEYFKWKNHYKYHKKNLYEDTNDYCGFCKLLNDERKMKEMTVYENFREWWNPPNRCGLINIINYNN